MLNKHNFMVNRCFSKHCSGKIIYGIVFLCYELQQIKHQAKKKYNIKYFISEIILFKKKESY